MGEPVARVLFSLGCCRCRQFHKAVHEYDFPTAIERFAQQVTKWFLKSTCCLV